MALNAVIVSQVNAESMDQSKYDKLYEKMTKNINTGKSNDDNYKLIENVLKKRNKELKDLYLQSEYVVKPEFLEWLVSFSGFYTEKNLGDNTSNNAKYRSEVDGYFDLNGHFVSTGGGKDGVNGKPYADLQKIKSITIGASIPEINIAREPIAINAGEITPVSVTPSIIQVEKPELDIILAKIGGIEIPTAPVPPSGLGSSGVIINPNQLFINNPLFSSGVGTIAGGTYSITGTPNDGLYQFTTNNEALNFTGNISVDGSSGVITSNVGSSIITGASIINDANMTVKSTGVQGFHSNSSLPGYLKFTNNNIIDIEYQSTATPTQSLFFYGNIDLVNNGTINFLNSENVGSFGTTKVLYSMWNSSPSDPNPLRIENNGTISVTGNSVLLYSATIMAHHYGHLLSTSLGQHTVINNGTINLENALGYLQDWSTGIYDASGGGIMNVNTNAVGIELTLSGSAEPIYNQSSLKVGTINVNGDNNLSGNYSKAINMTLNAYPTMTVNISDGTINLKSNSMGIITDSSSQQKINNSAAINITGGNSYGIISYGSASSLAQINNSGDISVNVNGSSTLSAGIYHQTITPFTNTGNISVVSTGINSNGLAGILLTNGAEFTND